MSIFKGDSIYKSGAGGAGGGGYSDGGALVDGDFIEVTNNSISTYDNTSRDPVNFYFEVADGEIVNSVIEMTTAVNATVNVYVVKEGFYYVLGNVGGNTVTSGNDYKINITGDSYTVEKVDNLTDNIVLPINGRNYPVKKIGNLYWTTENLDWAFPGITLGQGPSNTQARANYYNDDEPAHGVNGDKLGLLYNTKCIEFLKNVDFISGFRIPTKSDFDDLKNGRTAIDLISTSYGGNDLYGFNGDLGGLYVGGSFVGINNESYYWCQTAAYFYQITLAGYTEGNTAESNCFTVRLCRDA